MALQVTSAALGDITGSVGTDLKINNQASRKTATLDFTFRHATQVLASEDEIQVYDGAVRVFRGKVRNPKRQDTGPGPMRRKVQAITCQDTTTYLADDVVDATLVLAAGMTDRAMIQAVVPTYSTKGLTAPDLTCQVVLASMPAVDVSGMTLYEALEAITAVSGASFYVDDQLRVHNYTAEAEAAPFALVDTTANGSTRIGYRDLVIAAESFELVNALWVTGGPGTTPTWRPAVGTWPTASHTAYGRRERPLRLPDVKDQAELVATADALLATTSTPAAPITLRCYRPGLRAGQTVTLESNLWAVNQAFPVVSVETTIQPGTKSALQYDVTLGDLLDDLGGMIQALQRQVDAVVPLVVDVAGPDLTPPGQVAGLTLNPGLATEPDGSGVPYLVASWTANGDSDLDAYELEVDAADQGHPTFTASASGTGGTLTAGLYTVVVTGLGIVAGETTGLAQQIQVAAGQHLYVNIAALGGMAQYRVYAERATVPHVSLTTATVGSNVDVTPEGSAGATPPSESTAVDFAQPQVVRTQGIQVALSPVQGGIWYQARVRAQDRTGNRSTAWSALASAKTASDTSAPAIPTGLAAVPGYRLVGLTWTRNQEADLDRYQVRYFQGAAPPADPTDWTTLDSRSTVAVIMGLDADTGASIPYVFQVQAVDRSGNPSGWSNTDPAEYVVAYPTLVGAADLAVNSVVTTLLNAGTISADDISGGTVSVGGLQGATTQVSVYDSVGRLAGLWSDSGLVILDVTNDDRRIRMAGGALQFSADGGVTWATGMDADGITASAILLGSLAGGPNSIPNAGMELTAFSTKFTKVWTLTADWSADIPAAGTNRVNVDRTTGDLKLTTYT